MARVSINIPSELDSFFRLTVQKNDFKVPEAFVASVRSAVSGTTKFQDFLNAAEEAYRNAPKSEIETFSIGEGIPSALKKKLARALSSASDEETTAVDFVWELLPQDHVFEIRFSPPAPRPAIVLNKAFRDKITGGKNSSADAPLVKALIFLLVKDVLSAKRMSNNLTERLNSANETILLTLGYIK